jgi:hypothetical protein
MLQKTITLICFLFLLNSANNYAQDSTIASNIEKHNCDSAPFQKANDLQLKQQFFKHKAGLTDYSFHANEYVKSVKKDQNKYISRKVSKDWLSVLLVGIIILLAYLNTGHGKVILALFQAYWSNRMVAQFAREDNFFKLRTATLFLLIYLFVISLLIYNSIPVLAPVFIFKGFALYGRIFILVTGYYLLKYILMKFSAYLFAIPKLIAAYLSIMAISNFVYVLVILPILLFYQFLPVESHQILIYLLLFLWVFNAIYKYFRSGAYVSSNFRFPKFYLFIYLCTLELMPLLVIYKILIGN